MLMIPRSRILAFYYGLAVLCASGSAAAQDSITATSGSASAIARIRAAFAATERDALRFRRTTHDLDGFSLEGGVLDAFYDGKQLRKLSARLFGETWRGTESYYFSAGRLVFIHVVHERYDRPMSGRVRARLEHRFYFDNDQLIRRVRTQSPRHSVTDLSSFDPDVTDLLTSSTLYAACAAAVGPEPEACKGPEG